MKLSRIILRVICDELNKYLMNKEDTITIRLIFQNIEKINIRFNRTCNKITREKCFVMLIIGLFVFLIEK